MRKKQTIIGSNNGLSPGRRQAIIWTNAEILLIGPLGNLNRNLNIFTQENIFENVVWKMAAILSRPQCVKAKYPDGSPYSARLWANYDVGSVNTHYHTSWGEWHAAILFNVLIYKYKSYMIAKHYMNVTYSTHFSRYDIIHSTHSRILGVRMAYYVSVKYLWGLKVLTMVCEFAL